MGNMLYRKYRLYEDGMEIMVPSHLHILTEEKNRNGQEARMGDTFVSNYNWISADRRVVINVTGGGNEVTQESLLSRLQEYYDGFKNQVTEFECLKVTKRRINGYDYGELQYRSETMGYGFFTIFIMGIYEGREVILTLQCMERDRKDWMPIFMNISESLRILRKKNQEKQEEQI